MKDIVKSAAEEMKGDKIHKRSEMERRVGILLEEGRKKPASNENP